MKKKFELDFWHALIIVVCINVVFVLLYFTFGKVLVGPNKVLRGKTIFEYLYILLYIPVIFLYAKKTNTNFKESLFIPDLSTVLRMLIIVIIAEAIVLAPFAHLSSFIEALMGFHLRVKGSAIRSWSPFSDSIRVIISPIIEEFFFRGLILKNFLQKYSVVKSILLSSLLFSILHLNIDNLILFIASGAIFGIIYYITNSLIIVSLSHITWNLLTFLLYTYIELDVTSSILHLSIYVAVSVWLVYQLKKDLKKRLSACKI
jgi:membrane protease YdiL (CAAX protease family)